MNAENGWKEHFETAVRTINFLAEDLKDSPNSRSVAVIYQLGLASGFAAGKGWNVPMWFTIQGFQAAHIGKPMIGE